MRRPSRVRRLLKAFISSVRSNHVLENSPEANVRCGGSAALDPSQAGTRSGSERSSALEAENAAIAARAFRIVGVIVFLFQFLYLAADHCTMAQYQHVFFPYYVANLIGGILAITVTYSRWFPALLEASRPGAGGLLAATGADHEPVKRHRHAAVLSDHHVFVRLRDLSALGL